MNERNESYIEDDIKRSFIWLNNRRYGCTELVAVHPGCKPGKANFMENLKNKLLPIIWYIYRAEQAIDFVSRYHKDRTCLFGINPRPRELKNERSFRRSARDEDIMFIHNTYIDMDFTGEELTDEHIAEIELFIEKTEAYFEDIGINPPVTAFSGNGYHLLFAFEAIRVSDHPDIGLKLVAFKDQFVDNFSKGLKDLKLKVDSTQDLRRMAKIYGTKKPGPKFKRISRFYGDMRIPDPVLRNYLVSIEIKESDKPSSGIIKYGDIPASFQSLLKDNELASNLWEGKGKTEGDTSNSGYDFSLIILCMKEGILDLNELASILVCRPNGAYRASGKGESYIKQTISSAVKAC